MLTALILCFLARSTSSFTLISLSDLTIGDESSNDRIMLTRQRRVPMKLHPSGEWIRADWPLVNVDSSGV